jgi:hypothetical protein
VNARRSAGDQYGMYQSDHGMEPPLCPGASSLDGNGG